MCIFRLINAFLIKTLIVASTPWIFAVNSILSVKCLSLVLEKSHAIFHSTIILHVFLRVMLDPPIEPLKLLHVVYSQLLFLCLFILLGGIDGYWFFVIFSIGRYLWAEDSDHWSSGLFYDHSGWQEYRSMFERYELWEVLSDNYLETFNSIL